MRKYILMLIVSILCLGCIGQKNELKEQKHTLSNQFIEEVESPKGSWKVAKEYDENGNIIRYDSIYAWSSNNGFNDLGAISKDSILENLQSRFFKGFSSITNNRDFFSQDSLFMKPFFKDDFFKNRIDEDFNDLKKEMWERQKKFMEKNKSLGKTSDDEIKGKYF